jgi:hypothetical protein
MFDNNTDNQDTAPIFALDQDMVQKAATGLDFLSKVDQTIMQRIQDGDSGALLEAMNSMAQQAYATGLQHTATLTDKFVQSRSAYDAKTLPDQVRGVLTHQELSATNVSNHPVIQAQLATTAKQIAAQYPDASPQWIATQAKQYVIELANALNPQTPTPPAGGEGTDWDDYFKS